jgi:hypothetical protein
MNVQVHDYARASRFSRCALEYGKIGGSLNVAATAHIAIGEGIAHANEEVDALEIERLESLGLRTVSRYMKAAVLLEQIEKAEAS